MTRNHLEQRFEPLMEKLGYHMNNINLLVEAMTRQSAIQEKNAEAASRDFQRLEFLGDRVLNLAIADFLIKGNNEFVSEEKLHQQMQQMITNRGTLVKIAKNINIEQFLIKGRGESTITDDMCADALEALLGAIYIDCYGLMGTMRKVIKSLWAPYIDDLPLKQSNFTISTNLNEQEKKELSMAVQSNNKGKRKKKDQIITKTEILTVSTANQDFENGPLSPTSQRLFTAIGKKTTLEKFTQYMNEATDINKQNIGKKGDTALMMLLRKKKLRDDNEIPKIDALIKARASWSVKNRQGISAEDLLKEHPQKASINQLKKMECRK